MVVARIMLLAVLALIGLLVVASAGDIVRYLKMRSM